MVDYDKSRFFSGLSQSYKAPHNVQMQLHISCIDFINNFSCTKSVESVLSKGSMMNSMTWSLTRTSGQEKPVSCYPSASYKRLIAKTLLRSCSLKVSSTKSMILYLSLDTNIKGSIIDICKGIRRVIQIDVNDKNEISKQDTEEGTGFLDQNKLEVVDHNKQFFRISLDVNFRNIDHVVIKHQAQENKMKLKPSTNDKLQKASKSISNPPKPRSSKENHFSKGKCTHQFSQIIQNLKEEANNSPEKFQNIKNLAKAEKCSCPTTSLPKPILASKTQEEKKRKCPEFTEKQCGLKVNLCKSWCSCNH
ncbi:unnamed protein product [Moneuplotes crassus]|uniref:Uncharacterized protein n=1 Tax=Euplotes crassus TaxID=5936 RepID=A0AAD1XZ47_EUPCR|nr:unnamed protein product [Moneuplotes crassus]